MVNHFRSRDIYNKVALVCFAITIALGVMALLGWISDRLIIASFLPGYKPMPPNAALLFILLGIIYILLVYFPTHRLIFLVSMIAVLASWLVGVVSLIELITGLDTGINHWLFHTTVSLGGLPIVNVSPIAGLFFIFFGTTLLLFNLSLRRFVSVLSTIALIPTFMVSLGFILGAPLFYTFSTQPVAFPAVLAFGLINIGIIYSCGPNFFPLRYFVGHSIRARLLRVLLPLVLTIILFEAWLALRFFVSRQGDLVLLISVMIILMVIIAYILVVRFSHKFGTEIDLTEKALRNSENNFRSFFEYSPIPLWEEDFSEVKKYFDVLRVRGVQDFGAYFNQNMQEVKYCAALIKLLNVNQAGVRFVGVSSKEEIYKHLLQYFMDGSWIAFRDEMITLAEGKTHFECEIPVITMQGEQKIISAHLSVIPGYEISLSRVLFSFIDITEQRQAAEAIRKERDRAQNYLDVAGVMIVGVGADQKVSLINKKGCQILGYEEDEIIGKNWFDHFIPKHTKAKAKRSFLELIAAKTKLIDTQEGWIVTHSGEEKCISWHNTILYDDEGKFVLSLGSGEDITKRKQVEEALRESEQRYRSFVVNFSGIAFRLSLDFTPLFLHGSVEEITGYVAKDFMNENPKWIQLVHPDDFPVISAEDEVNFHTVPGYFIEFEYRIIRKDGYIRWVHETLQNVCNEVGVPILLQGIMLDITERRQAEELLKLSLDEKEVLLREIHHRVKNNMQVMISLLDLQSGYIKDNDSLSMIQDSQNRIRSMALVHEELFQSRDLTRISFSDYIDNLVAHLFGVYNINSAINLNIDVEDISLNINSAIPCGLIVNELVSNALKYAFPSGITGTVTVSLHKQNRDLILSVADDGVVSPEKIDISDPASLGLELINILARQLGGSIKIEKSNGTKVTFQFSESRDN